VRAYTTNASPSVRSSTPPLVMKVLRAVDHVGVAVAARARRHREHVGADAGLGHAHAADPLARRRLGQHALLCTSLPFTSRSARTAPRARAPRARSRVRGRERLAHLHRRDRVEPGAAVLLGQRDAEQPELARAAEQRAVERLVAVVLGGLRLDLARDERASVSRAARARAWARTGRGREACSWRAGVLGSAGAEGEPER
jgi:hypothetical protein